MRSTRIHVFAWCGAATFVGAFSSVWWQLPGWAAVAGAGVGVLWWFTTRKAQLRPNRWALIALGLAAGIASTRWTRPQSQERQSIPSGLTRLEGIVISDDRIRTQEGLVSAVRLRVLSGSTLDGEHEVPRHTLLWVRGASHAPGSRIAVLGRLRARSHYFNPTPRPLWPGHFRAEGSVHAAATREVRRAPWPARVAFALRTALRNRVGAHPGSGGDLALALVVGDARTIRFERREVVRQAGMSHLLAVSGLHVSLLCGAFVALLRRALLYVSSLAQRVDVGRIACAVGVLAALGYAYFVGDSASAYRAAFTSMVAWGARALGRRVAPLDALGLAAMGMGIMRPDDISSPALALSLVATAAIARSEVGAEWIVDPERALWRVISSGRLREAPGRWLRSLMEAARVSLRATLATAPLVWWLFGSVPLIGVLANTVFAPIAATVLLPLGALHVGISSLWPALGRVTAPVMNESARLFFGCCELFAQVDLGTDLPPPSLPQLIALGVGAASLIGAGSWRVRWSLLALASLGWLAAEVELSRRSPTDELRITVLDVGQGDATWIDLPDRRLMLIDGGDRNAGHEVIAPLLRANRRRHIDVFVLTHGHPDHYGGLDALVDEFSIGELWDNGQAQQEHEGGPVAHLVRRATHSGTPVPSSAALCAGRHFGQVEIMVRWPCPEVDAGYGLNENSIVIELRYGRHRFLFTGDIERHAESELAPELTSIDFLKVAHHGSRTSSSLRFLARVDPAISVASTGRHNRFGHPHPEVWHRLRKRVRCALRTDRHGAVTVLSNGRTIRVETQRSAPRCRNP